MNAADRHATSDPGLTLVCFALKEEAAPFRKRVADRADIAILITGIGRANSERAVRAFAQGNTLRRVFTCGFAGGLNPQLKTGEVVFATSDTMLRTALFDVQAKPAVFACVDRIATTVADKNELRKRTQADAVEMESQVIESLCANWKIPCATVRVISDPANEDLPLDFNALSNPDQRLNFGKLAMTIAKSPAKIPALLRLQKQTSFAAEQLAAKLATVLKSSI